MDWWKILKFDEELYEGGYFGPHRNTTLDIIDELRINGEDDRANAIDEIFNMPNIRIQWLPGFGQMQQQLGAVENPRVREPTEEEREQYIAEGLARPDQNIDVIDERDIVHGNNPSSYSGTLFFTISHVEDPDSFGDAIGTWFIKSINDNFTGSGNSPDLTPQELVQYVNARN